MTANTSHLYSCCVHALLLTQRHNSNKEMQTFHLSKHHIKKMPPTIWYTRPAGAQSCSSLRGREGCLLICLYLPYAYFLQARILAKSVYKVQPGDRENRSSGPGAHIRLPQTCSSSLCSASDLWSSSGEGRRSWGGHRKSTCCWK